MENKLGNKTKTYKTETIHILNQSTKTWWAYIKTKNIVFYAVFDAQQKYKRRNKKKKKKENMCRFLNLDVVWFTPLCIAYKRKKKLLDTEFSLHQNITILSYLQMNDRKIITTHHISMAFQHLRSSVSVRIDGNIEYPN